MQTDNDNQRALHDLFVNKLLVHNLFHYYDDHDHGTLHHHHGPGNHDILIHDHDGSRFHHHIVISGDYNDDIIHKYGPANHDHDTDDTATDAA